METPVFTTSKQLKKHFIDFITDQPKVISVKIKSEQFNLHAEFYREHNEVKVKTISQ